MNRLIVEPNFIIRLITVEYVYKQAHDYKFTTTAHLAMIETDR